MHNESERRSEVTGWLLRALVGLAGLVVTAALHAASIADAQRSEAAARLFDPGDGWFDISGFLDTAYGFVPLLVPITEPAVGYGAAGALVFVDRPPPGGKRTGDRPNIAVIGAAATENGTRGAFAGHLGTWLDGRLRTLVGLADADVNLDFFGFGGDRVPGREVGYSVAARGGVAGANYRLGDTSLWLGLRYAMAQTHVALDAADAVPPEIAPGDTDLRLAALTPSITLDLRDNFFTPTKGWYVDLSAPLFRKSLGSDRDFEKAILTAIHYRPLPASVYLSVRGTARTSTEGTPFYLRPFVMLRGAQALRYQGTQAGEVEGELRWQLHPRFSLVGFGGAGIARSSGAQREREQTVTTVGAGFRYLLARQYGMHVGVDVAHGPDGPVLYVVFGSAWIRP